MAGSIRLHFAHADGGLAVKGDKLEEFSFAGDCHKWFWADARIEGNTVVVSSPFVPSPTQVRYAWQSNPAATLFNGAGDHSCHPTSGIAKSDIRVFEQQFPAG